MSIEVAIILPPWSVVWRDTIDPGFRSPLTFVLESQNTVTSLPLASSLTTKLFPDWSTDDTVPRTVDA